MDTDVTPHVALIADLGVAIVTRNLHSIRPATRQATHSARWSAPEILNGENPSKESDVYSFGMVMLEVGHEGSATQMTLSHCYFASTQGFHG